MKRDEFLVELLIQIAVAFCGLLVIAYLALGCSGANFDIAQEGEDHVSADTEAGADTGADGEDRGDSLLAHEDVSASEAAPDVGESHDAAPDAPHDSVGEALVYEHRIPTGERYSSSLPAGIYSPALYGEMFAQVKVFHPGTWSGPYEATCDLSSDGHSSTEKCLFTQSESLGVMACPFGISYVRSGPSCPPAGVSPSWW